MADRDIDWSAMGAAVRSQEGLPAPPPTPAAAPTPSSGSAPPVPDASPDEDKFEITTLRTPKGSISLKRPAPKERPAEEQRPPQPEAKKDVDFGTVLWAVRQTESGNRQFDEDGDVILGPRTKYGQAIGKGQLMPSTAAAHGVDPYTEEGNDAGSRAELARLKDKYGSWEDALAGYVGGDGTVDAHLRSGRPYSTEVQNYIDSVMSHAGVKPAGDVVAAKRAMDSTDWDRMGRGVRGEPADSDVRTVSRPVTDDTEAMEGVILPGKPEDDVAAMVLKQAAIGAAKVPLGAAQAVMEQVNPQRAAEMSRFVNELENSGYTQAAKQKYPMTAAVADAVGTAIGVGASAGVIGGVTRAAGALPAVGPLIQQATAAIGEHLGWFTRGAIAGGTAGALQFHDVPTLKGERAVEGVVGGLFGGLVGSAAGAIYRGGQALAQKEFFRNFVELVKANTQDVGQASAQLQSKYQQELARVQRLKNQYYTVRNAAGEAMPEGFDRAAMGQPIADAVASSRLAGVALTARASGVARQVDRELGGPEVRALEAQHELDVARYEKEKEAWEKAYTPQPVPGSVAAAVPKAVRDAAVAREVAAGRIPEPPVHPGEFEPPPITTQQYSAAKQAIQGARERSTDQATRKQLDMMREHLESAARETADTAGMDVSEFIAAGREADKFNRETYAPLLKLFGKEPGKMDASKFYDVAVAAIEGKRGKAFNADELRRVAAGLGDTGREQLFQIAAKRVFDQMTAASTSQIRLYGKEAGTRAMAAKAADYINAHRSALEILGGPEMVEKLQGVANLAQELSMKPQTSSRLFHMLASHGWLQAIGAVRVFEGVYNQRPEEIRQGVGMMAVPVVGHALYGALMRVTRFPGMSALVRRAGKTAPDTKEMDRLMAEFDRRVRTMLPAVAGAGGIETSGPVGRPLAPVGASVESMVPSPF